MFTMWYVYILHCSDNSLYTGITTNLKARLLRHNSGKGARYTKFRRPVTLKYSEEFSSKSEAQNREIEIKSFGRQNKNQLIERGIGVKFPSALKV